MFTACGALDVALERINFQLTSASGSTWGYFFSNPSQSGAGAGRLNRPCDYVAAGETPGSGHPADLAERSFEVAMLATREVEF